jgi:hypothetical protein
VRQCALLLADTTALRACSSLATLYSRALVAMIEVPTSKTSAVAHCLDWLAEVRLQEHTMLCTKRCCCVCSVHAALNALLLWCG